MDASKVVTPAELITSDAQFMRGHGTFLLGESDITSSIAGHVVKVNKLVSVVPIKSRYNAEVGDVVVGRIVEVGSKRWKVDLNGKQDAALLLSSVNLPGGVQRRRLESDELQMRSFFKEGDVVVAEVQMLHHDDSISLHTRSLKYGKLKNGVLVSVPPLLVRRSKAHFFILFGIDIFLGVNGKLFLRPHQEDLTIEMVENNPELLYSNISAPVSREDRLPIARLVNCIAILSKHSVQVNEEAITHAYTSCLAYDVKELLSSEVGDSIATMTKDALENNQ